MLNTVAENKRGFTPREWKEALQGRKLLHATACPAVSDPRKMMDWGLIDNCPVKPRHLDAAEATLGKDLGTLKGESTRKKPLPVVRETMTLPPELTLIEEVELCIDIMCVTKVSLFTLVNSETNSFYDNGGSLRGGTFLQKIEEPLAFD